MNEEIRPNMGPDSLYIKQPESRAYGCDVFFGGHRIHATGVTIIMSPAEYTKVIFEVVPEDMDLYYEKVVAIFERKEEDK